MGKKIKKRGGSSAYLRKSIELKKQELFNISLHYADLLGAKKAAEGFINELFEVDEKVFWSWGPEWCESLAEYKTDRPVHRGFVLLAFFAYGSTFLVGHIVNQWNGKDPFKDELTGKTEENGNAE